MPYETITIQTTDGPERCRAEVHGLLAIHRGVNGKGLQNVTHVPTGKAVIRNLTKRDARIFVQRVAALDWTASKATLKPQVEAASVDIAYGRWNRAGASDGAARA